MGGRHGKRGDPSPPYYPFFLNYIIKSSLASLPRESFPKKYKTLFSSPRFQNPPLLLILAISFSTTHLSHSLYVIIIKLKERQPTLPYLTKVNYLIELHHPACFKERIMVGGFVGCELLLLFLFS